MLVERLFERVKDRRLLIELPKSFENRQVEIIVLTVDESVPSHRHPHPDIAGKVKITGDIMTSVPEDDWNLPR